MIGDPTAARELLREGGLVGVALLRASIGRRSSSTSSRPSRKHFHKRATCLLRSCSAASTSSVCCPMYSAMRVSASARSDVEKSVAVEDRYIKTEWDGVKGGGGNSGGKSSE